MDVAALAREGKFQGPLGYFLVRITRRGPPVAARIWVEPARDPETGELLDRPPTLRAMLDGVEADPYYVWTRKKRQPIGDGEYHFRLAMAEWAREYAPHLPEAKPDEGIDMRRLPPLLGMKL